MQRRRGGLGRVLAPEIVDQAVGRNDAVRVQEQQRQQGALSLPAQFDRSPVTVYLERPEEPKFEHVLLVTPKQAAWKRLLDAG